ncbi:11564_t:CDS:10, partial [Cetraspora pellucida]
QIHEVAKLREFANDVLNKKTIQEEWSKEKDQELKQHKENYEEISTVPIGMQFEELAIIDLAKQIRYEISRFKTTNRIVSKNKKEKEKEIPTVNTPKMERFIKENLTQLEKKITIKSEFATENIRKQFQAKYKELLRSLLEKQGQMWKPQSETFSPEGTSKTRYEPKENIYRERPSSLVSDDEDFKLASRNVEEWLRNQTKTPPERSSSSVKEFINKNIINPLFRRHSRNISTTSLPQIPFKLKNEVNPEEDEEEFKLQNPSISRLKRQRSIRKNREIRRKMFKESKKEDITSDNKRNMKELDKYESDKEEETQGYRVPDSEDGDSLYAHFKEMPIEVPSMNIGHISIENSVENGYIGTPVNLAKKEIIVQSEIVNDINTKEIPPIHLNLKGEMKDSEALIRDKRQTLIKYNEEDKKASLAVVITKKTEEKKIAIDYRMLNKYLEQYREPLPDSKQMLQKISKYKYYIIMDIKLAYWQLVMHKNSKKYIATTFAEYGTYCWHALLFGLSTAPAYLIRTINKILEHLDYVVIYIDDFVILLNNKFKAKIKLIETVECLKKVGLKIKPSKCEFLIQVTIILNCKVLDEKIEKNVLKIKEMDKFVTPKNKTELQRFLGFMNYFRSFILDFAKVATPLYGLVETAKFK